MSTSCSGELTTGKLAGGEAMPSCLYEEYKQSEKLQKDVRRYRTELLIPEEIYHFGGE